MFFSLRKLSPANAAEEPVGGGQPEKPGAVLQQRTDRGIQAVVGTEVAKSVPLGGGIGRCQQESEHQR
jgi:hypothetical protein